MNNNAKNLIIGLGGDKYLHEKLSRILVETLELVLSKKNTNFLTGNMKGLELIEKFFGYDNVIIFDTIEQINLGAGNVHVFQPSNQVEREIQDFGSCMSLVSAINTLKLIENDFPKQIYFVVIEVAKVSSSCKSFRSVINKDFNELFKLLQSYVGTILSISEQDLNCRKSLDRIFSN